MAIAKHSPQRDDVSDFLEAANRPANRPGKPLASSAPGGSTADWIGSGDLKAYNKVSSSQLASSVNLANDTKKTKSLDIP